VAVKNFHAAGRDSIRKRFVEIRARHLIRVFPTGSELSGEVEVAPLVAAKKHGAVLLHEVLLLNGFQKTRGL
jgi:hypothetical protein